MLLSGSRTVTGLLAQAQAQRKLHRQVQQMLPAPLNRHLQGALLKDRHLILYADSSAWSSRLRFYARQLQKQMNQQGAGISKITLRVMPESRARKKKQRMERRRLPADAAALIRQTAESIHDPGLSAALRRLARHQE